MQQQNNVYYNPAVHQPQQEPIYNPNLPQPVVMNYAQPQYYQPPQPTMQSYQPPVIVQQPLPTMPPSASNNMMNSQQKLTTTTFQNLISQKSSTLHELTLQNQDSLLTYLCCASLGCFRVFSLRKEISHIKMLPSVDLSTGNSNGGSSNQAALVAATVATRGRPGCCGGCCDGCCRDCCSCHNCNCGNCDGEGILVLLVLLFVVLVLSFAILAGIYMVTAPIALFLIIYFEKITTIEFDDEKREVRMTSRARYLREHFIFSTYSVSYDQIHSIKSYQISEGKKPDYCLALMSKDGKRVNMSKPLELSPDDVMSGASYMKEFFKSRGVVLVDQYQFVPHSTSTIPMNHQMV